MKRRRYTQEFKAEAVRQAIEPGVSKAKVASDLQINATMLCKWIRDAELQGRNAKADSSAVALAQEVQRLHKELARVKMERDILKKATAYFAKESS